MQKLSSVAPSVSSARTRPAFVLFAVVTVLGCVVLSLLGFLQPVVLGIVQGVGEFLPISSSAHLIVVPWLFGWEGDGIGTLTFDVALHLGTLVAVVAYFWRDWMTLLASAPGLASGVVQRLRGQTATLSAPQVLLLAVLVATVPAAVLGLAFESLIELYLRSPLIPAATLAIVGIILYMVDRYQPQHRSVEDIGLRDALLIGFAQACALVPGVSRSGATMTMGRYLGLERAAAARFSFLLSAPITAAAVLVKLDDILNIQPSEVATFLVGTLVSAAVGALAIHFLLSYIRRVGFGVFALYRIALAVVIVLVAWGRG